MYKTGEIIDAKYQIRRICSDAGGMGCILHVTPLETKPEFEIVLKYCRDTDLEQLKRFQREVRLLDSFKGNSKVVQVFDYNLEHDPPYFIMKFYSDGDLSSHYEILHDSYAAQEELIFKMIDCLQVLHARNVYHRDIKPENFLLDGNNLKVSDLGLTREMGSSTAFTRSSDAWGTPGYLPPEFRDGGFKHADATSDIFMLGKTIYVLLSGRDPMYPLGEDIPSPIFHIIERCCNISKSLRYQSLVELKKSLSAAYDVILNRNGGIGRANQLIFAIEDKLKQEENYDSSVVIEFVEQLALLENAEQIRICFGLSPQFFSVIGQNPIVDRLSEFLSIYTKLVEDGDYSFSYAETIANNMHAIFIGQDVPEKYKAIALDLAIQAAYTRNRYAAMDTCRKMVTSIYDEAFALEVASIILKHGETFISEIEPSECNANSIRNALIKINTE